MVEDLVGDQVRLLPVVLHVDQRGHLPLAPVGLQLLVVGERRLLQRPVGEVQNLLRGAVVQQQLQFFGVGDDVGEGVDGAEVGTAKGVDALRVVAHAEKVRPFDERFQQLVLEGVGVLHLIHQHMPVSFRHRPAQCFIAFQLCRHHAQHVVVVDVSPLLLVFDVFFDDRCDQFPVLLHVAHHLHVHPVPVGITDVEDGVRQAAERVDSIGVDGGHHLLLHLLFPVVAEVLPQGQCHRAEAVVLVERRVVVVREVVGVEVHDLVAPGVKGSAGDLFLVDAARSRYLEPLGDLFGRFAGEGEDGDVVGLHPLAKEVVSPCDDGAGLARAGPGQHQQVLPLEFGGFLLLFVELDHLQMYIFPREFQQPVRELSAPGRCGCFISQDRCVRFRESQFYPGTTLRFVGDV